MPRPSRKNAVLAAALTCFAELGYDATRVRHIAQRAALAESALYRHYPSKEAIAQEIYTEHMTAYADALTRIADGPGDPAGKLAAVVRAMLDAYRREPRAFTFTLLQTPSFLPRLPPGTRYPIEVIERIIAEGQRARVVRAGQPNLLAAMFAGCILQPIAVATLAAPAAMDLHDQRHDSVLHAAALAVLAASPGDRP